jgi:hypothetical protein
MAFCYSSLNQDHAYKNYICLYQLTVTNKKYKDDI